MLKFFKKIRQKLIIEKKLSSYIFYALGEIILVVIGILIALAINNSNLKRIKKDKEQIYLAGLRNEFETSRLKLIELMEVNRISYQDAKKIVGFISDEKNPPSEKQFSELLLNAFSFDIAFNPNNSLLNEMISSGSLRDISSPTLRIKLTNWVATLEDIAKQEEELGLQREKVVDLFRTNQNSIRTIFDLTGVSNEMGLSASNVPISNLGLLKSTEFENNILLFILTSYATETTHYTPLMKELNSILDQITLEIDND